METVDITEVDAHDDRQLRAFWEVEQAAMHAAFDRPVLRTYDALAMIREPHPYYRRVLLAATIAAETVGVADIGLSHMDNRHLADLEIHVLPGWQRRGIGRRLYAAATALCSAEARTTVLGEASVADGQADVDGPSYAFATAMGAASVHQETHLVLDLPTTAVEVAPAAEWEIVIWVGHCPEEYAESYCRMRTQMNNDVPRGDIDSEPITMDVRRLRVGEARTAKLYHQIVSAARHRTTGEFGGYSMVFLAFGETAAMQDDTLVMPEHRGQRLGLHLKLATLAVIQHDHPEFTAIHTWTDPDNHAMLETNLAFGYRPVDRMHEMQAKLM